MKSVVLVLIIVAAVYAADEPSERHGESDAVGPSMKQWLEDLRKLEEEIEQYEGDGESSRIIKKAFDAVLASRPKRSWAEKKEKRRLIEIDALVEKLWADKEKQANDKVTDAPVTEQTEKPDIEQKKKTNIEHEVKAPRRNGSRPRFENSSEHSHGRRKSEKSKHEKKHSKKVHRKPGKHAEDEEHSDKHSVQAEKRADKKRVVVTATEVKHRKIEKHKKKFIKHHKKEESDEDEANSSEDANTDSTETDPKGSSPTANSRKVPTSEAPAPVESEPATEATEESFVSESASPAPLNPATAASVNPISAASANPAPMASAKPVPTVSADPPPTTSPDSTPAASANTAPAVSANPIPAASTGASDGNVIEEVTAASPDQVRVKRRDSSVAKKDSKTEKQVQEKPTGLVDDSVTDVEPAVIQEEKTNTEQKNKTSAVDSTSRKHESPNKKGHHDEKKVKEKKSKPVKKVEQAGQKGGRNTSGKARNSATKVREDADKHEAPASLIRGNGKMGSGDLKQWRTRHPKYESSSFVTASPKSRKTYVKNTSANAADGIPNKEKTPAAPEAHAAITTTAA